MEALLSFSFVQLQTEPSLLTPEGFLLSCKQERPDAV